MSRPIKFRAWDPDKNRMTEPFSFEEIADDFSEFGGPGIVPDNLLYVSARGEDKEYFGEGEFEKHAAIPMQFTGLKDSKGKEIYESDIIDGFQIPGNPMVMKGEVVFIDAMFALKTRSFAFGKWRDGFMGFGANEVKNAEVIGNVYENKDLLK